MNFKSNFYSHSEASAEKYRNYKPYIRGLIPKLSA
jgi:retron-type reverse transcriptase